MCPACISTATIVIGGTVSGGGLTSLAIALREQLARRKNIHIDNQSERPKQKS